MKRVLFVLLILSIATGMAVAKGQGDSGTDDGTITVGMAWPGMQDAVWSTSHKLLNEFAAASDAEIELVFTAADMDVAKQSSDANDLISELDNIEGIVHGMDTTITIMAKGVSTSPNRPLTRDSSNPRRPCNRAFPTVPHSACAGPSVRRRPP